MAMEIEKVPIHLKVTLTIREAAEYSNIGINKIDSMLRSPIVPLSSLLGRRNWSSVRSLSSLSAAN